jgi:thiamine biosynthesis protein ThiS
MSSTESISVNGTAQPLKGGVRTVADLLTVLRVPLEGTLVEQNGVALFPRDFGRTPVAAGDRFELVRIAAGG